MFGQIASGCPYITISKLLIPKISALIYQLSREPCLIFLNNIINKLCSKLVINLINLRHMFWTAEIVLNVSKRPNQICHIRRQ